MDPSTRKPNSVLRHQRMNRGWSQQRVAEQLDTTEDMISKWERGISKPSPFYQEKLCNLFDMTAKELDLIDLPPTDQEHVSALLMNNLLENQEFLAQLRQSILQDFVKTVSEIAGQSEHIAGYSRSNSSHLNEDLVVFFETMI